MLSNRKSFKDSKDKLHYKKGKALKYKEPPTAELATIKDKIRNRYKKQRRVAVVVTVAVTALFFFIIVNVFKQVNDNDILNSKYRKEQEYKSQIAKDESAKSEKKFLYYINKGYQSISQEKYRDAKYYFYKADEINKNDFHVMMGNAKAYVYDCVYNHHCENVDEILDALGREYGTMAEVQELIELYKEEK